MAKILLVEDDSSIRKNLKLYLTECGGYQVVEAVNGLDAMEKIKQAENKEDHFDLVITDNQMPGVKGSGIIPLVKKAWCQINFHFWKLLKK